MASSISRLPSSLGRSLMSSCLKLRNLSRSLRPGTLERLGLASQLNRPEEFGEG